MVTGAHVELPTALPLPSLPLPSSSLPPASSWWMSSMLSACLQCPPPAPERRRRCRHRRRRRKLKTTAVHLQVIHRHRGGTHHDRHHRGTRKLNMLIPPPPPTPSQHSSTTTFQHIQGLVELVSTPWGWSRGSWVDGDFCFLNGLHSVVFLRRISLYLVLLVIIVSSWTVNLRETRICATGIVNALFTETRRIVSETPRERIQENLDRPSRAASETREEKNRSAGSGARCRSHSN
ncbi:hypothetical protein DFH06DRAFT_1177539 [Mycena polygramma]|nr:hypothetical protein DFH06DRAFT_1177539 [Mycena polygramma]